MNQLFFAVALVVTLAFPPLVLAHPGNTASDGCHYCRTNCAKWGEVEGARHCHGGSAPAVQPIITPTKAPTSRPTVRPTVKLTPVPKPAPTSIPSPTPPAAAPSIEPTMIPKPEPTPSPQVLGTSAQPKGFWAWLISLFAG